MLSKITSKQFACIAFIAFISNKLLILPSILYNMVETDAILVVVIKMLLGFLAVGIIFMACRLIPNVTLDELMNKIFGKYITKILLFIFLLFYIFKTYLIIVEGEGFINTTIYEELNFSFYTVPLILIALYVVFKGLKIVGRVNEIAFIIIFIGLSVSFILSATLIEIDAILPMFTHSFGEIMNSSTNVSIWFGNSLEGLVLLGCIKVDKNFGKTLFTYAGLSVALVLAFFYIYYSLFEGASGIHPFALSEITEYTPELISFTKFDWFTIIVWLFALIMQTILQFMVIVKLLEMIFGFKPNLLLGVIIFFVSNIAYLLLPFNMYDLVNASSSYIGKIGYVINWVELIVVFVAIVIYLHRFTIKKRKNREVEGSA